MKFRLTLLLLASSLALFTGCQTIDSRIKNNPQGFAQIDPPTQEKIKRGIIDLGYSEDMIYFALGAPDQKKETISTTGRTLTWIYNSYNDPSYGAPYAGFYHPLYYDPAFRYSRGYYFPSYYYPGYAGSFSGNKEERIRIIFSEGKVTVIEQAKD